MTMLATLPLLQVEYRCGNNEDWRDSIQFLDADSNPVSLAGIAIHLVVRDRASDCDRAD